MRLCFSALLSGMALLAQVPATFKNLQFYPKDTSRQELMAAMRNFSFSLGYRCVNCHVSPSPDGRGSSLEGMDFASDAKETKKTTRVMLQMVQAMNRDYLGKLGGTAKRVECITCHRGLSQPRALQSVLMEELDRKGLAAAISLYRDLRKRYYGGAQYDFSETSLNLLTEGLQAKAKHKEAVAFMELNSEVNTLSDWGRNLLAMAHRDSGATTKAIADFQAIVEKNPGDKWAKTELEKLKKD
jgi:hypothetical protein